MQACDRCHSRKTRCDRRLPQCGGCEKAGTPCVHADKLRQRNLPRGYIDNLEKQVQQLRAENEALQRSLADSRAAFDAQSSPSADPRLDQDSSANPTYQQPRPGSDLDSDASSPASSILNPIAVEVGYLSLVATGETRYLGSSSGLGLANIISTIISVQGSAESMSPEQNPSSAHDMWKNNLPATPADETFPPFATAKRFIDAYFQHTHIAFPLLHRPTFLAATERIYREPGYYENSTFDAFVFDMVLAIGSSCFNRFYEVSVGSSTYFSMAQSKLITVTSVPGLQALKAILLVSQHGIFSNLRDKAASMWHLVGVATRMCFELGLHLERKKTGSPSGGMTISYEDEMKKRCFWCLYNLDRVVSFTLGRPVAIRDDEIDVSLPSHLDDDLFGPDKPLNVNTQDSRLSPFLHIIQIRRLSGQILGIFYNSQTQKSTPVEERLCVRRRFHRDIDAWMAETSHLQLVPVSGNSDIVSSFLTMEWYQAVYNNAILLLYRPSPYLPYAAMATTARTGESDLMRVFSAAKSSIESYGELHRNRRLNYSWITLHGIFVAGLAYVYSIGGMIRDSVMCRNLPDVLSIIDVCRRCSNVLVAICERWDASRRSCEIFDRVSTTVIRDALNASSLRRVHPEPSHVIDEPNSPRGSRDAPAPDDEARSIRQPTPETMSNAQNTMGPPVDMPHFDTGLATEVSGEDIDFSSHMDEYRDPYLPRESASGLAQTWPFDFPFSFDGALDGSRGSRDVTDWGLS